MEELPSQNMMDVDHPNDNLPDPANQLATPDNPTPSTSNANADETSPSITITAHANTDGNTHNTPDVEAARGEVPQHRRQLRIPLISSESATDAQTTDKKRKGVNHVKEISKRRNQHDFIAKSVMCICALSTQLFFVIIAQEICESSEKF
ncbi:hypothetical protein GE061_012759 [Apolygus lucorum]|uniref:Uncharacterized protein n=1 Tax=Apolygus lucorum TaxID=248454 RepID=A0A8S9XVG0_APOLU|nr:hypothetical protein GE061_012759 [Apolygus lucorum]